MIRIDPKNNKVIENSNQDKANYQQDQQAANQQQKNINNKNTKLKNRNKENPSINASKSPNQILHNKLIEESPITHVKRKKRNSYMHDINLSNNQKKLIKESNKDLPKIKKFNLRNNTSTSNHARSLHHDPNSNESNYNHSNTHKKSYLSDGNETHMSKEKEKIKSLFKVGIKDILLALSEQVDSIKGIPPVRKRSNTNKVNSRTNTIYDANESNSSNSDEEKENNNDDTDIHISPNHNHIKHKHKHDHDHLSKKKSPHKPEKSKSSVTRHENTQNKNSKIVKKYIDKVREQFNFHVYSVKEERLHNENKQKRRSNSKINHIKRNKEVHKTSHNSNINNNMELSSGVINNSNINNKDNINNLLRDSSKSRSKLTVKNPHHNKRESISSKNINNNKNRKNSNNLIINKNKSSKISKVSKLSKNSEHSKSNKHSQLSKNSKISNEGPISNNVSCKEKKNFVSYKNKRYRQKSKLTQISDAKVLEEFYSKESPSTDDNNKSSSSSFFESFYISETYYETETSNSIINSEDDDIENYNILKYHKYDDVNNNISNINKDNKDIKDNTVKINSVLKIKAIHSENNNNNNNKLTEAKTNKKVMLVPISNNMKSKKFIINGKKSNCHTGNLTIKSGATYNTNAYSNNLFINKKQDEHQIIIAIVKNSFSKIKELVKEDKIKEKRNSSMPIISRKTTIKNLKKVLIKKIFKEMNKKIRFKPFKTSKPSKNKLGSKLQHDYDMIGYKETLSDLNKNENTNSNNTKTTYIPDKKVSENGRVSGSSIGDHNMYYNNNFNNNNYVINNLGRVDNISGGKDLESNLNTINRLIEENRTKRTSSFNVERNKDPLSTRNNIIIIDSKKETLENNGSTVNSKKESMIGSSKNSFHNTPIKPLHTMNTVSPFVNKLKRNSSEDSGEINCFSKNIVVQQASSNEDSFDQKEKNDNIMKATTINIINDENRNVKSSRRNSRHSRNRLSCAIETNNLKRLSKADSLSNHHNRYSVKNPKKFNNLKTQISTNSKYSRSRNSISIKSSQLLDLLDDSDFEVSNYSKNMVKRRSTFYCLKNPHPNESYLDNEEEDDDDDINIKNNKHLYGNSLSSEEEEVYIDVNDNAANTNFLTSNLKNLKKKNNKKKNKRLIIKDSEINDFINNNNNDNNNINELKNKKSNKTDKKSKSSAHYSNTNKSYKSALSKKSLLASNNSNKRNSRINFLKQVYSISSTSKAKNKNNSKANNHAIDKSNSNSNSKFDNFPMNNHSSAKSMNEFLSCKLKKNNNKNDIIDNNIEYDNDQLKEKKSSKKLKFKEEVIIKENEKEKTLKDQQSKYNSLLANTIKNKNTNTYYENNLDFITKIRRFAFNVKESISFVIIILLSTLFILLVPDLQKAVLPITWDNILEVFKILILFIFLFEIILNFLHSKHYLNSFLFWMDMLALISVIQEIKYVSDYILEITATNEPEQNEEKYLNFISSLSVCVKNMLVYYVDDNNYNDELLSPNNLDYNFRYNTISQVLSITNISRIIKMLRLIRLINLVKLYKMAFNTKKKLEETKKKEVEEQLKNTNFNSNSPNKSKTMNKKKGKTRSQSKAVSSKEILDLNSNENVVFRFSNNNMNDNKNSSNYIFNNINNSHNYSNNANNIDKVEKKKMSNTAIVKVNNKNSEFSINNNISNNNSNSKNAIERNAKNKNKTFLIRQSRINLDNKNECAKFSKINKYTTNLISMIKQQEEENEILNSENYNNHLKTELNEINEESVFNSKLDSKATNTKNINKGSGNLSKNYNEDYHNIYKEINNINNNADNANNDHNDVVNLNPKVVVNKVSFKNVVNNVYKNNANMNAFDKNSLFDFSSSGVPDNSVSPKSRMISNTNILRLNENININNHTKNNSKNNTKKNSNKVLYNNKCNSNVINPENNFKENFPFPEQLNNKMYNNSYNPGYPNNEYRNNEANNNINDINNINNTNNNITDPNTRIEKREANKFKVSFNSNSVQNTSNTNLLVIENKFNKNNIINNYNNSIQEPMVLREDKDSNNGRIILNNNNNVDQANTNFINTSNFKLNPNNKFNSFFNNSSFNNQSFQPLINNNSQDLMSIINNPQVSNNDSFKNKSKNSTLVKTNHRKSNGNYLIEANSDNFTMKDIRIINQHQSNNSNSKNSSKIYEKNNWFQPNGSSRASKNGNFSVFSPHNLNLIEDGKNYNQNLLLNSNISNNNCIFTTNANNTTAHKCLIEENNLFTAKINNINNNSNSISNSNSVNDSNNSNYNVNIISSTVNNNNSGVNLHSSNNNLFAHKQPSKFQSKNFISINDNNSSKNNQSSFNNSNFLSPTRKVISPKKGIIKNSKISNNYLSSDPQTFKKDQFLTEQKPSISFDLPNVNELDLSNNINTNNNNTNIHNNDNMPNTNNDNKNRTFNSNINKNYFKMRSRRSACEEDEQSDNQKFNIHTKNSTNTNNYLTFFLEKFTKQQSKLLDDYNKPFNSFRDNNQKDKLNKSATQTSNWNNELSENYKESKISKVFTESVIKKIMILTLLLVLAFTLITIEFITQPLETIYLNYYLSLLSFFSNPIFNREYLLVNSVKSNNSDYVMEEFFFDTENKLGGLKDSFVTGLVEFVSYYGIKNYTGKQMFNRTDYYELNKNSTNSNDNDNNNGGSFFQNNIFINEEEMFETLLDAYITQGITDITICKEHFNYVKRLAFFSLNGLEASSIAQMIRKENGFYNSDISLLDLKLFSTKIRRLDDNDNNDDNINKTTIAQTQQYFFSISNLAKFLLYNIDDRHPILKIKINDHLFFFNTSFYSENIKNDNIKYSKDSYLNNGNNSVIPINQFIFHDLEIRDKLRETEFLSVSKDNISIYYSIVGYNLVEGSLAFAQTIFIIILITVIYTSIERQNNKLIIRPMEVIMEIVDSVAQDPANVKTLQKYSFGMKSLSTENKENPYASNSNTKKNISKLRRLSIIGNIEQLHNFNNINNSINPLSSMNESRLDMSNNYLVKDNKSLVSKSNKNGLVRAKTMRKKKKDNEKKKDLDNIHEVILVRRALIKIAELLSIGLGEAGAELIRENLRRGNDYINPTNLGKRVYGIFGFIHIQKFNEITICLQETINKYLNEISQIVHSSVDKFLGAPNKNIGEGYLLCWKLANRKFSSDVTTVDMHNLADCAVLSFLDIMRKIKSSKEILQYRKNIKIREKFPDFEVKLNFGLHVGWAVEGAIGSSYKIDVSYLSPNVNISARVEAASVQYGVDIMITGSLYELLSYEMQRCFRKLDQVNVKGSKRKVELYTIDFNTNPNKRLLRDEAIEFTKDKPEFDLHTFEKDQILNIISRKELVANYYLKKPYFIELLNSGIPRDFYYNFEDGMESYISGDWEEARDSFEECLDIKSDDKPTKILLNFLKENNYSAPNYWEGVRELVNK